METVYNIGACQLCKQGILEILQDCKTGEISICCDECLVEWDSPEDALQGVNGYRDIGSQAVPVSIEEMKALHWERYLKN